MTIKPWFATRSGFALMLADKVVSTYETRVEADSAMDWYIRTYGAPSDPLTVITTEEAARETPCA